jgi:hypothetical protein
MAIEKVCRTITEKTTSVEQPIELTQKGIIQFVPKSGKVLGIPCLIPNPKVLTLIPMTLITAQSLSASGLGGGWYSDLSLHYATAVSNCFLDVASTVLEADKYDRIRMKSNYTLYQTLASMAATSASYATNFNQASLYKQLPEYGTNAKKYLVVNVANSASALFKVKKQKLAYEIRGY